MISKFGYQVAVGDILPNGMMAVDPEYGYAADLRKGSRLYGWLFWKDDNGIFVSKRALSQDEINIIKDYHEPESGPIISKIIEATQ
jgi:hypothetical protein